MTISVGDKLPDATFIANGPDGPEPKSTGDVFGGRRVALFGLPGAFTGTCTEKHLPSFVKNADALSAKGVDAIVCVAVNDPFVMKAWGESTGAVAAGLHMLCDPLSEFTKALGLNFSAPPVGLVDRSKRYSMLVEDGVVKSFHLEESPGEAKVSTAEVLLGEL